MRMFRMMVIVGLSMAMMGCATKINKIKLYEAPKPDAGILSTVSAVMRDYIDKLEWKNECVLEVDTNGILETNWHPVQSGDEKRKIQIYVWGSTYRVDVWHKSTFGPFRGSKDYMSRLVEMNLQFEIDKRLAQAAKVG